MIGREGEMGLWLWMDGRGGLFPLVMYERERESLMVLGSS